MRVNIKKMIGNLAKTLTALTPIAAYSLFLGALSSTCLGLYLDFSFFPESLFYIQSIVFYFFLYFLLQCQNLIKSGLDTFLHAGLSGLFLGFFSYQVFNQADWFRGFITIWEYKVISYLVISSIQAAGLIAARDWLARKKQRRLEAAKVQA